MSEFASQTSQAAQEEVAEIAADPDQDDGAGASAGDRTTAELTEVDGVDDAKGEQEPTPAA